MNAQEQQTRRQRPRPVFRTVQVRRIARITPGLARVTVAGSELEGFSIGGPAEHIRMYFPAPGQDRPVLPEWGPDGPVRREGQERPVARVYTPRRWDPATGELDVDVVLHGGGMGPGVRWAQHAKAGDAIVVSGPAGAYRLDPDASEYVIAGDHAGLPAVATILESLPAAVRARVFVEVEDASEELELESRAQIQVTWLHSGHNGDEPGRLLAAALRDAELADYRGRVFVACEASIMRDIRRHLLEERGLDRSAIHTHGYWKLGVADHPDHDLGQEI
jgi:NADPH-dependent ferric siderophore reductase